MARRKRSIPTVETLEGRVVLSAGGPVTLAALGDSYTAQYGANPTGNNGARNWVEILSATHRATFAPRYGAVAAPPTDSGFPYDHAIMGASTSDILNLELPGLLPQVASGAVPNVSIFAGIIDFGQVLAHFATNPDMPRPQLDQQVAQTLSTATTNLDQIVSDLFQANPRVKIVVATIPDMRQLPLMVDAMAHPGGQALGDSMAEAARIYNDHIRMLAALNPSIAVADVASTFEQNLGVPGSSVSTASATLMGIDIHDTFQYDGLHPNTITQGWIANDMLSALRSQLGVRVASVSQAQIQQYARHALKRQSIGMPLP